MVISNFSEKVISIILKIPKGKVSTYGQIAKLAGNPRSARQVSWILHSSSRKYDLPWHRVINSKGVISMKLSDDKNIQKQMLEQEGVEFLRNNSVNLKKKLWKIDSLMISYLIRRKNCNNLIINTKNSNI